MAHTYMNDWAAVMNLAYTHITYNLFSLMKKKAPFTYVMYYTYVCTYVSMFTYYIGI